MGWAVRLAKRVEELHRLGVAHGGVSANIILSSGPSCQGRGILGDVRQAASRPSYHSPERHEGRGISPADDTWGAAVTLYLMLTGRMPYDGTTSDELASAIARANPAPLAVFGTGDDALQAILDRFLARSLAHRTTNMGAFRQALEQWYPPAAGLHPLEEGEDDSLTDFDEDDEELATVMRDFSDVREQLKRMGAAGSGARRPAPARPRAPAPAPRPVPTPGVRAPAASSPGIPSPTASSPGMRPPVGSSPGMMSDGIGARPPMPSQPGARPPAPAPSHPGFAPPGSPSSPGAAYHVDDEDSDDEGATLLLDTSTDDVQKAIEAALTGATTGAPPGWPAADDDEPDGGQRTIGLAEAGLDFSDVPDPTGGEAPFRPGPPPGGSPFRPAPAGFDPTRDVGDNPPQLDATMAFPEGTPMPGLDDRPLQGPSLGPGGGGFDSGAGGPVGGAPLPGLEERPGGDAGGLPAPVPPPQMYVPEVEDAGGGLRTALIVASVILVIVVIGVVVLWLDRSGTIDLPI